jgi:hypothetical protein
MAKVVFTPNVQRHVACPEAEAAGQGLTDSLDGAGSASLVMGCSRPSQDQAELRRKRYQAR